MSAIFICGPSRTLDRRRILKCPVENRRRRMVVNYGGYWGSTVYCCGCGDSWSEGELNPRPFRPGWRKESIARAKERWQAAPSGPMPGMCEQLGHDDVHCDCGGDAA